MKIKFLGTGGALGSPIWSCDCKTCISDNQKNKRQRSVVWVQIPKLKNPKEFINVIIDFGQDFSRQLINNNIKHIDYAFLTHEHWDHSAEIWQLMWAKNCKLCAHKDVWESFFKDTKRRESLQEMSRKKLGKEAVQIFDFEPLVMEGVSIDTVKLLHGKNYTTKTTPCYGYVFRSEKFSFAYLSDFNDVLEPEKLEGLDLIVSDGCTWEDGGIGHIGVFRSVELFKQFKPKRMLLTHMNHEVEYQECLEYLKQFGNIAPAYDGLIIEV